MYIRNTSLASNIANTNKPLYDFLLNKWYFDEIYNYLLVKPAISFGRVLWKFLDEYIIDGFGPNGIASSVLNLSIRAKKIQSGYIYHYAFAMLIGLVVLITWLLLDYGI